MRQGGRRRRLRPHWDHVSDNHITQLDDTGSMIETGLTFVRALLFYLPHRRDGHGLIALQSDGLSIPIPFVVRLVA
jgi:hypothetical protein